MGPGTLRHADGELRGEHRIAAGQRVCRLLEHRRTARGGPSRARRARRASDERTPHPAGADLGGPRATRSVTFARGIGAREPVPTIEHQKPNVLALRDCVGHRRRDVGRRRSSRGAIFGCRHIRARGEPNFWVACTTGQAYIAVHLTLRAVSHPAAPGASFATRVSLPWVWSKVSTSCRIETHGFRGSRSHLPQRWDGAAPTALPRSPKAGSDPWGARRQLLEVRPPPARGSWLAPEARAASPHPRRPW